MFNLRSGRQFGLPHPSHLLEYARHMTETYWDARIETLAREDLARLQRHRLNWQLRRCWDGSPFYRERLEAAGLGPAAFADVDILSRLPILARSELLAEAASNPPFGRVTVAPDAWWKETDDGLPPPRRVWTDGDVSHRADIAARALTAAGPEESPQLRVFGLPGIAPTLAYACVERAGRHWAEDHFLVEIVGAPSGQTCADGETGDVVLTDLTREGSPLLRFSTGFTAALDRTPCACGRTSARSASILPRESP
jgi:phenylacetate-coenzyme A ligase PaaK-like adenylate-forming protein